MRPSPSSIHRRTIIQQLVVACLTIALVGLVGTAASAAPGNPTSVAAESKAGTASATISWVAPVGATRFRARAYIGNVAVKVSSILSASTTRHTFVGLEYKIPYTLKVQAGDGSSWGTEVGSSPSSVVPEAAAPSAPDKPTISVVADNKIEAKWTAPASTGGSPIDSYQVQLRRKGDAVGDPVTVKGVSYQFTTEDKTGSYSVTVKAVNAMAIVSPSSEESESIVPELKAAVAVTVPRSGGGNTGNSGGGNSGNSGGGNSGGGNSGNSGGGNTGGGNVAVPLAASPVPALPATTPSSARYTKSVRINSKTSKRTILTLSKLKTSRASKVTYTISSKSRKICSMSSTSVRALRSGTCSVKVTVKTGRTTSSRTVKLLVTRASKANVLHR